MTFTHDFFITKNFTLFNVAVAIVFTSVNFFTTWTNYWVQVRQSPTLARILASEKNCFIYLFQRNIYFYLSAKFSRVNTNLKKVFSPCFNFTLSFLDFFSQPLNLLWSLKKTGFLVWRETENYLFITLPSPFTLFFSLIYVYITISERGEGGKGKKTKAVREKTKLLNWTKMGRHFVYLN